MKQPAPPQWMEHLLKMLLPARDRESVAGDLYEEFGHRASTDSGADGAKLWYLRQIISFLPRRIYFAFVQPSALTLVCAFTALCGSWLGAMNILLHHPVSQLGIAAGIVAQALLTLAALHFRQAVPVRLVAMIGCLPLLWLAASALRGIFTGANMEGYILLIALALVAQAALTLCTLPAAKSRSRTRV